MCLMESADDGKTWKMFDAPAGNQRIERRLIVLDGSIYITTVSKEGEVKVYRFNGKGPSGMSQAGKAALCLVTRGGEKQRRLGLRPLSEIKWLVDLLKKILELNSL
jgi:hypothetical protein